MAQSYRRNAYSAQLFHDSSGYSKANSSNSYTRMINSSSAFINTAKTAADTVIGSIRTAAKISELLATVPTQHTKEYSSHSMVNIRHRRITS